MSRIEHTFKTQGTLVEMLSKSIAHKLKNAIQQKGKATLIVSGGNTPKPLFGRLSEVSLAWEKVTVGLCDERWIPPNEEESNENLVKRYLLQGKASKAKFVGMYIEGVDIQAAVAQCEHRIQEKLYPFDVLVLGMGSDGHTASLFPGSVELERALALENNTFCVAVSPKSAPYERASLTRSAILSAAHLYLYFEGEDKIEVYQKAVAGDDVYQMPVRSILHQNVKDVEVYYT